MKKYYTLCLCLTLLTASAHATVWFVRAGATGTNTGTSWTNAFLSLQSGIAATTAGDTVWVANGTYKPTTTTSRSASFVLPSGVVLLGGFAGTETLLSQRNYSTFQTILSGDIGQPGLHTDNSYSVVTANSVSSSTRLDGFKIVYGRADGSSSSSGGGLYCTDGSPTIANCFFTENYATGGGALRQANSGTVNILNCSFTNNTSSGYGGAIYVGSTFLTGTVNIRNCNISGNQAGNGGGCYFYTGAVTVDRCIISGNIVSGYAGAIYEDDPTLTVSNSLIVGNTAPNFAMHYQDLGNSYPTTFVNCTIAHNKNTGASPGNDFLADFHPTNTIRNCIVWGNGPQSFSIYVPTFSNDVLQGGYVAGSGTSIDTLDPLFAMPAIAAQAPFLASGFDYHLTALSTAIDTGNNSYIPVLSNLDLDGNARTAGGRVDLGAYESSFCSFSPSITPAGTAILCPNTSLSLTASGGTGYRWSTGAATASISVTAPGYYRVTAVNAGGCRGAAWVHAAASASYVQITAPGVDLCPGGSILLSTVGNNTAWSWNNGAQTAGITVTAAGFYKVTATASDGCVVKDSITINAASLPQPVVANNGGILQTGPFATYQWLLNGTALPGATAQTYTPLVNGAYSVRVTNIAGCVNTSAAVTVSNAGIAATLLSQGIYLFPNPATDVLRIQCTRGTTGTAQITLMNNLGQVMYRNVYSPLAPGAEIVLPVAGFSPGVYQLRMTINGYSTMDKVVIPGK